MRVDMSRLLLVLLLVSGTAGLRKKKDRGGAAADRSKSAQEGDSSGQARLLSARQNAYSDPTEALRELRSLEDEGLMLGGDTLMAIGTAQHALGPNCA
jgi:hypothetical protein